MCASGFLPQVCGRPPALAGVPCEPCVPCVRTPMTPAVPCVPAASCFLPRVCGMSVIALGSGTRGQGAVPLEPTGCQPGSLWVGGLPWRFGVIFVCWMPGSMGL